MPHIFQDVVVAAKWIGKETEQAVQWLPKVVKLANDVESDAKTLLPELTTVIVDCGELGKAAIADDGAFIADFGVFTAAVTQAAAQGGINIAEDEAVLAAAKAIATQIASKTSYAAVIAAVQQLVVDYDKLGASAKTAIAQLEADA